MDGLDLSVGAALEFEARLCTAIAGHSEFLPWIEQHRILAQTAIEDVENERRRSESEWVAPLALGVADQKHAAVEMEAEAAEPIDEVSRLCDGESRHLLMRLGLSRHFGVTSKSPRATLFALSLTSPVITGQNRGGKSAFPWE